jgi:cysteinyl-tRNA synthetase
MIDIQLYNTLNHKKEVFTPINPGKIGMYCCGPTVYDYQHIGNLRTYIFEDLLKRMFLYNGYGVKHIVNITDVGHLVSDEDEGEDKMEVGAEREGKSVWEIARHFTEDFINDTKRLNILQPDIWCKATEHIQKQIELIQCLEKRGFTYVISGGVYFDTSKLSDYGKLANLDIEGLRGGARIEVHADKKNKTDFALWKFSPKDKKRHMEWDSPWGKGFPGWHIECSAMSMEYLGRHFDIHCGGVDHIPVHHTNEIAQSESCTGEKFVNCWVHGEFLVEADSAAGGGKMSKSKGEFLRLQTLVDEGYDPMEYRYFCLGTYYRKHLQFSWENLDAARNAYSRLKNRVIEFKKEAKNGTENISNEIISREYRKKFNEAINDDLNIPAGLGVMWDSVRDGKLTISEKLNLLYDFDKVFGLNLKNLEEKKKGSIPDDVMKLVEERAEAKAKKDFKRADEIRKKIKEIGYEVVDRKEGVEVKEIKS